MMTEQARSSVVEIYTNRASGTGWIYRVESGKAWILTNEHVIRGSRTVTVRLAGRNGTRTGTVVGHDEIRDLAVLTICCNTSWQALPTVTMNAVRVGSDVVALGFPSDRLGLDLSVTTGVVSSFGFHDESRSWLIQTDAALNPGNSGGPLLDGMGHVIGVVSARVDPARGENIGFAISMRTVELELDYLERGRTVLASPTPRPTRAPTAEPPTGTSGMLTQSAGRYMACLFDGHDFGFSLSGKVLSATTVDIIAGLRFWVPNASRWSIGFLFHDVDISHYTEMYVYRAGDRIGANYLIWTGGEIAYSQFTRFEDGELRIGPGQQNHLTFATNKSGSHLFLNGEIVDILSDVPVVPRRGKAQVCVGMHFAEQIGYTIRYSNLLVVD